MRRIPVTTADLESGRIAKSVSLLRKLYPDGKAKLSPAQELLAKLLGYRDRHDLHSCVKANGPVHPGFIERDSVVNEVGKKLSELWSISYPEAVATAAKLHLGNLDICQTTARPLEASNHLGSAIHAASGGGKLIPLTPGDLIGLGAPGFTYAVANTGSTFVWDDLFNAVDQITIEQLLEWKAQPEYSALPNLSAVRDAYVRDVVIPRSSKPLMEVARADGMLPEGFEMLSIFNPQGEFRGRSLYNPNVRGLVPILSRDDRVFESVTAIIAGQAPRSEIIRDVKPGEGKGRVIHFNKDGTGPSVHSHVDSLASRHPGQTYIEYAGAEQAYVLAPQARHHESDIARLIANGFPHQVKIDRSDLVALDGVALEDTRFPDDIMDIQIGNDVFDFRQDETPSIKYRLCGVSFYERRISYIAVHQWITVDDIPEALLSAMGTMDVLTEPRGMFTDTLPKASLDLHYQIDAALSDATLLGQRIISSSAGSQQIIGTLLSDVKVLDERILTLTPALVAQGMRYTELAAAGGMAKAVIPNLDELSDLAVGSALAMSNLGESLAALVGLSMNTRADLISWLAFFVAGGEVFASSVNAQARTLLLSTSVSNETPLSAGLLKQAGDIDEFTHRLADQGRFVVQVKRWRDQETKRWSAARKLGVLSVGAAVETTSQPIRELSADSRSEAM